MPQLRFLDPTGSGDGVGGGGLCHLLIDGGECCQLGQSPLHREQTEPPLCSFRTVMLLMGIGER